MRNIYLYLMRLFLSLTFLLFTHQVSAQIDVEHVISIGRNALYFNDYVVSIGYFNRVIDARPWLAEPYLYRSIAKISLEDYHGALSDATACIERNAYLSRAYLVRAVALQNLDRNKDAITDYKKGLKLSPDDTQMRFNLAVAQVKVKDLDASERTLDSLLRYNPKHAEAYALRASVALERGDTTLALQRVARALKIDPKMSMPYRLEASVFAERGAWYDAIRALTQAIQIDTESSELYSNRAILYYQVNKIKDALQDYSRAIELDPKNKVSLNNRAILRQQLGEKRLALEDWTKLLVLEPQNMIARYNRATLYIDLGQELKTALNDLNLILESYPSFVDGFIQRALLKNSLGDKRGASNDYFHANYLVSNQQAGKNALSQAKANQKRRTKEAHDASIDKYALLIEQELRNTPEARYKSKARGRVQDRDVTPESRGGYYLTFFRPQSADGQILSLRSNYSPLIEKYNQQSKDSLLLRLESTPQALTQEQIDLLQKILEKEASDTESDYYCRRGIVYSLMQDYEQAMMEYNRSLTIDDKNVLALWGRSIVSMRQQELRQSGAIHSKSEEQLLQNKNIAPNALQDLNRLITVDPNFAYAYYNRALLYEKMGKNLEAIKDYSRSIELYPQLADAYYNRGLLYLSLRKTQEGISDLSQAGELGLYEAYNIIKRMK